MFFTQEDYNKIYKWIQNHSIKDSEFNEAHSLTGGEYISFVQGGDNVKLSLSSFVDALFSESRREILNITNEYSTKRVTLLQAISLVPNKRRSIGQIITFIDDSGQWRVYQFQNDSVSNYSNPIYWVDLIWAVASSTSIIPDGEDITSVNAGESTVIKFRDKGYSKEEYSGLGRIYLRKNIANGKNILTNDMISTPNTRYIIQYDYDLDNEIITIPEGCVLDFQGGSLGNGTIIGSNTVISAYKNIQIFSISRDHHYIGGTWKIDKWYCSWFGTVNDGKAYRAKYDDLGNLVKSTSSGSFEVIIEGTDNFEPIQEALDAAYNTNIRVVELGLGVYRIAKPLNIGWGGYQSINFKGVKQGHFGDITEANIEGTIILCDTGSYGICINSGCGARISDFDILGWNGINYRKNFTSWHNTTYYVENPEDWNSERVNKLPFHGLAPMSPYAGIVTDAFIGYEGAVNPYELPKPPVNIDKLNVQNSTGLIVERVTSNGFCVGFGLEVGNYSDNADFYRFYNCAFNNNVYGLSTGSNQARNTALYNCNIGSCYTAISNNKIGKQNGGLYGYVSNCWFDMCYRILEYKGDISPVTFYNCYCENTYTIGKNTSLSSNANNVKFIDCNFRLTSSLKNPLGLPAYYFYGAANFVRTCISLSADGILVPLLMERGVITDSQIIGNTSLNLASSRECLFDPYMNRYVKVSQTVSQGSNRMNEYSSIVGTSATNIIQMPNSTVSKELLHTYYSYDEDEGILTLNTDWTGTIPSYEESICVGDIIFQRYTQVIYVIVKITPSEDYRNATILCTPLQGFRKANNKYILSGEVKDNVRWTVYSMRYKAFSNPLIVTGINGKELVLKSWDNNLKAGIILSSKHDYEHSLKFESGLVESVDSSQKKIILKYGSGIDDTFKVINGYMAAREDANFWQGSWVQEIIDKYNK